VAGQPKAGLDYAGWSTSIFDGDTKIDKLLDGQGWIGFSIYFFLCQMAYKFDGYFYRWSYDDAATTARRMGGGVRSEAVRQTVSLCLQIGLFDKRLFDRDGILTSRGIQRRYCNAIKERRRKSVIAEYWVLTDSETNELVKGLVKCAPNSDLPPANGDLPPANCDLPPANDHERKEKESKEKERKEEKNSAAAPGISVNGSAMSFFLDRVDPMPSERTRAELADFEADLGAEVCIRAMMIALNEKKAKWPWIRGILKNKRADGIRSLAAWDAQEAERQARIKKNAVQQQGGYRYENGSGEDSL